MWKIVRKGMTFSRGEHHTSGTVGQRKMGLFLPMHWLGDLEGQDKDGDFPCWGKVKGRQCGFLAKKI